MQAHHAGSPQPSSLELSREVNATHACPLWPAWMSCDPPIKVKIDRLEEGPEATNVASLTLFFLESRVS